MQQRKKWQWWDNERRQGLSQAVSQEGFSSPRSDRDSTLGVVSPIPQGYPQSVSLPGSPLSTVEQTELLTQEGPLQPSLGDR